MELLLSKRTIEAHAPRVYVPGDYRDGAEGMIDWCNTHVCVPIYPINEDGKALYSEWCLLGELPDTLHPKTKKSYKQMWEAQQEILREALRMEDGEFVYRLLIFCWMRGEGKSLLAVLIQLWKFFNWPRQQIMLGANSKDQVKFVHFDIMRDIIINSPRLMEMVGPRGNIQEKEIRLKDDYGDIKSLIRSISSFSGIVSNITGYTFSEIFDMKKPKFFTQLDGSIRNIPNALGVIDSTVSSKLHVLYRLYENFTLGKTKAVFFSYRCSTDADLLDYWNPNMTEDQLSDYQVKFPFGEFERYFQNLWSAGIDQVFSSEMIEEMGILGCDGGILNHSDIRETLVERNKLVEVLGELKGRGLNTKFRRIQDATFRVDAYNDRLKSVENLYHISEFNAPCVPDFLSFQNLTDVFDTHFALMAGVDFGDPFALNSPAKTILVVVAKGLPGSRSSPYQFVAGQSDPRYLYLVLYVTAINKHDHGLVKQELDVIHTGFEGVDVLCSERYGAWDIQGWCDDRGIDFQPIHPTYDKQKEAFKAVLEPVRDGRYKCPPTGVPGVKKRDIIQEEFAMFNHDDNKKWFGSTEKGENAGVQDDFMFANAWCIYGGRNLSVADFRIRQGILNFGTFVPGTGLLGNYA